MGKKLYVGNLPYSATNASLTTAFSECGNVETANVIMDRDSGRSKGFAFIEMSTDAEASAAILKFNGTDLDGRAMNVSEAKPQVERSGGGRGGSSGGGRRTSNW